MLSRKHRLSASFFKRIRIARTSPVYSLVLDSCRVQCYFSKLLYSRFAFVVPNKAFESIAERNKWRRAFYEKIRVARLHEAPGWDVVIFFKKGTRPSEENFLSDIFALRQKLFYPPT